MEIFMLICLAVMALCVVFWLFAVPVVLLLGAAWSMVRGIRQGLKHP
jgi:hypothetical protein